jgi:hypothetical protein
MKGNLMHSTVVRRIIRVVTASTIAAAASAVLLVAPVSEDAGRSLRSSSLSGRSL